MFKKKKVANNLKKRFTELSDLPQELVTNCSRMVLLGDKEFLIENYSGIIEYEMHKIRLRSASGIIQICGDNLTINELDNEALLVKGIIRGIEIEGND